MEINWQHPRIAESRFYHKFGTLVSIVSVISLVLLAILGVALLVIGQALGWLLISCGLWFLLPILWVERRLKHIVISKDRTDITGMLSSEVLANLPTQLTPRSVIESLSKTNSANFLAMRLGINWATIAGITPDNPQLMPTVWQEALNMWQHLPNSRTEQSISAAIVLGSIIRLNPNAEQMINQLRLDLDDVYWAVSWHEHIHHIIRKSNETRLTGGIARDWSFGYIPTLERFGVNISQRYSGGSVSNLTELPTTIDLVRRICQTLGNSARRNVALIGELGAGKSTIVEAVAETLMGADAEVDKSIKFNQIFLLDASSILSATSQRGEVERLVNSLLVEAYKAKNIIIFLDNAELFFADGTGSIDLSNILQPIIEGGALKLILAMDQQKFLQISQVKPALANACNRIDIKPADERTTMSILQDKCIKVEYMTKSHFTYQALKDIYRLSNRYINNIAQPRASVQLLENAANYAVNGIVTSESVANTIEQTLGIKVGGDIAYSNDEQERQKLLNMEQLIHQRMINQTGAVSAVSNALRRARMGVRNENRPIGTFLFLGPTGVGKTELAKALAEVYFGGEGNLVRIDLNEYVRPDDVARLIADGATAAMSLTAQVQKNPFSVVLLDEIEKAHPNVLTTLLQVLDEGVLRDINNREVSFRDTILIATSNALAERIRQYIEAGYQLEQFSNQIQDELINSGQFKPEFLNRFDEIAVFRPLTKDELIQVVDLILAGINKTLASQKVAVAVDQAGKQALVDAGYDPRLGARPMRRVIQRSVENIVAQKLLSGELAPSSGILLTEADIKASLSNN